MLLELDQHAEELKTCSLEIFSNYGLIKSLKLSEKRNQNNTSVHMPPSVSWMWSRRQGARVTGPSCLSKCLAASGDPEVVMLEEGASRLGDRFAAKHPAGRMGPHKELPGSSACIAEAEPDQLPSGKAAGCRSRVLGGTCARLRGRHPHREKTGEGM